MHKEYSDGNTDPVSVGVSCEPSGTADTTPQDVDPTGPGTVFQITGIDVSTDCTATENPIPDGYTADESDCASVTVDEGGDAECTIYNTLNEATVVVHKEYVGGGDKPDATIWPDCTSGDWSPLSATAGTDHDAVFTVTGFDAKTTCSAMEDPVPGYHQIGNTCTDIPLLLKRILPPINTAAVVTVPDIECTITNEADPASVTIYKSVFDTNPQSFNFTSDIDGCGSFSLADDGVSGDDHITCDNVSVDSTYHVQEVSLPAYWFVDSINCRGGNVDIDKAAGTVTLHIGAGDQVVCVFNNGYYDPSVDATPVIPQTFNWQPLPTFPPTPAPTATPAPSGQIGGEQIMPPNTGDGGLIAAETSGSSSGAAGWLLLVGGLSLVTGVIIRRLVRQQ